MTPFAVGNDENLRIVREERVFSAKRRFCTRQAAWDGVDLHRDKSSQLPVPVRWVGELSGELAPQPKGTRAKDLCGRRYRQRAGFERRAAQRVEGADYHVDSEGRADRRRGGGIATEITLVKSSQRRDRIYKFEPSKGFGNRSRICKTSIFPFKLARVTGTSPQNSQMS
jgi:hypothetical protein